LNNLSNPLKLLNHPKPFPRNLNLNHRNGKPPLPLHPAPISFPPRPLLQQESSLRLSPLTTTRNQRLENHCTLCCVFRRINIVIWEIMVCGVGKSMLRIGGPRWIGRRSRMGSMRLLARRVRDKEGDSDFLGGCNRCISLANLHQGYIRWS